MVIIMPVRGKSVMIEIMAIIVIVIIVALVLVCGGFWKWGMAIKSSAKLWETQKLVTHSRGLCHTSHRKVMSAHLEHNTK